MSKPSAIAITSLRQPPVDDLTVRHTGAIAVALCRLLDDRVTAQQAKVFAEAQELSPGQLEELTVLEVAPSPD